VRFRDFVSAFIWSIATAVAAFMYAVPLAVLSAAVGAFFGNFAGIGVEKSSIKLLPGLAAIFAVQFVVALLLLIPPSLGLTSSIFGAEHAYVGSQSMIWFAQAFFSVGFLRFLSGRVPSLVSLEVFTVAMMLVSPLAAHRQGFIHRPYFLVDPLWSHNQDPVPVFLTIGAAAAILLVLLSLGRRTKRASILDVVLLLVLILGLYLVLPEHRLKELLPEPKGSRGKSGGKAEAPPGKGGKGKSKGERDDEMPMDKPNESQESPRPIAVVLLRDDYDPPLGVYYFRQAAYSQFNGKRLVVDTTGRYDKDLYEHFPTEPERRESPSGRNHRQFKSLETYVALIDGHAKPFGIADATEIAPSDNPDPAKFVRAYTVQSEVVTAPVAQFVSNAAGGSDWDQAEWKHYTELPSDPRYKQLDEQILAGIRSDLKDSALAKAVAIKTYLDKTVYYTLKADHSQAEDSVADYLFVNPRGYCVHQAHAMVYLLRAAGIPARVGAGYATPSSNRGSGSSILLRSGEAHAWPELYLEGYGWMILDVTPEKADQPEMAKPDPGLQRMLGEMARKKEKTPTNEQQFEKRSLREILRALGFVGLCGALIAAVVALLGAYAWKYYRRFEPLWCSSSRVSEASLRSGLDQMAEVGEVRQFGESRLQFAKRSGYESLVALTEFHYQAAYGRITPPSKSVLQQRESLHHKIAKKHPVWKRVLGFLNPISWYYSK
jgi:protein-glutamine gamma-glutamyltransferase